MKKITSIVLMIVLFLLAGVEVCAASSTYSVDDIFSITIPDSYAVFIKNSDNSNVDYDRLGIDKETVDTMMDSPEDYVMAISYDISENMNIFMYEQEEAALLYSINQKDDEQFLSLMQAGYSLDMGTYKTEVFHNPQVRFFKSFNSMEDSSCGLQYIGILGKNLICITFTDIESKKVSESQECIMDEIVKSMVFFPQALNLSPSVAYSTLQITEKTNEYYYENSSDDEALTNFETIEEEDDKLFGFFMVLILSVLFNSVPILLYRFFIEQKAVIADKAKRVCIAYAILSFVFVELFCAIVEESLWSGIGVLLWGFLNYHLLTANFSKRKTVQAENVEIREDDYSAHFYNIDAVINNQTVVDNKKVIQTTRYCTECGSKLRNGSSFCGTCGTKIKE